MEMNVEGIPLFEYGIFQEDSTIRAHVGVTARTVFVFRTHLMRDLIKNKNYLLRPAGQNGVTGITAEGWLVPIDDIPDLREIRWRTFPWWEAISDQDSLQIKGQKAVQVVLEILRQGLFPFWIDTKESFSSQVQIHGTDILIIGNHKIQVKCDFKAGRKPFGTGNLYIQKAELNPFKFK